MNRWRKKNGRFDRHLNGRAEKYGWKMERWISYHGWMQGWIAAEGYGWEDGWMDKRMVWWMSEWSVLDILIEVSAFEVICRNIYIRVLTLTHTHTHTHTSIILPITVPLS